MSDRVFSFTATATTPSVGKKVVEVIGAINEDKSRFQVVEGPTQKGAKVTATLTYVIPSGRGNTDDVKRKVYGALKRAELLTPADNGRVPVEYTVTLVRPEKPAKAEKAAKEAKPAKAKGKAAKAAPAPVEAAPEAEVAPGAPAEEAPEVQGAEG